MYYIDRNSFYRFDLVIWVPKERESSRYDLEYFRASPSFLLRIGQVEEHDGGPTNLFR